MRKMGHLDLCFLYPDSSCAYRTWCTLLALYKFEGWENFRDRDGGIRATERYGCLSQPC